MGGREQALAVSNHYHRAAAPAQRADGCHEVCLAALVEAAVGLVEHEQTRVAVHGARQSDALTLAAGQGAAVVADFGIQAMRQLRDDGVEAGQRGGGAHLVHVDLAKAGDVLGERAVEELDVLRQVADMRAEFGLVPA